MQLCFAPMDGITNCATRLITKKIFDRYKNQNDTLQLRTEFMNADGFIINPSKVIRHILTTPEQLPIAQIYWGNEATLLQTAKILVEKYANQFSGIELNTWCPSNTVMKCGGGSDMLRHREKTITIIQNLSKIVKENSDLSFSVKSRAGLHEEDKPEQLDFLKSIAPSCDLISIHGRTLKQLYTGDADFWFINQVKQALPCKVIANWGITSYQMAKEVLDQRKFDGIMIGQGAIGNPRIFTQHLPSLSEKLETMQEHLLMMIACDLRFEEWWERVDNYTLNQPTLEDLEKLKKLIDFSKEYRSVVEFRKYLFQYIKGIPDTRERKQKVIPIKTVGELFSAFEELASHG